MASTTIGERNIAMPENVTMEPYITARCSGETHWIFSSKVNSVGM